MQIRIDFSWMWVQIEVVGMVLYEPYDDSLLASDAKINYFNWLKKKMKIVHFSCWFEVLEQFYFTYYCDLPISKANVDIAIIRGEG